MNEVVVIDLLILGACIGIAIMLLIVITITSSYEKQLQKENEKSYMQNEMINEIVSYAVQQNQKIKKIEKEKMQLKELLKTYQLIARGK